MVLLGYLLGWLVGWLVLNFFIHLLSSPLTHLSHSQNWKCLSCIYCWRVMLLYGVMPRLRHFYWHCCLDTAATLSLATATAFASATATAVTFAAYILSDTFSCLFPVLWLDWYVWCMMLQSDIASSSHCLCCCYCYCCYCCYRCHSFLCCSFVDCMCHAITL